jgi:hypothetical protein
MAVYHKGKKLSNPLHDGNVIINIYHMGKRYLQQWLSPTSIAAIRLAFGEEAVQVIKLTNAYLKTIKSTDPQRALQISGFINEDPLLVCSLVETSKTRWLVGDGKAWILLPVTFDTTNCNLLQMEAKVKTYSTTGWRVHGKGSGNCRYFGMNDRTMFAFGNNSDIVTNVSATPYLGKEVTYNLDFVAKRYKVEYGGNNIVDVSFTPTSTSGTHNLSLFAWQNNGALGKVNKSDIAYATYGFAGDQVAHFIPMQRTDGTCGMLDIISGTFHPNANTEGSFTIQLTDK